MCNQTTLSIGSTTKFFNQSKWRCVIVYTIQSELIWQSHKIWEVVRAYHPSMSLSLLVYLLVKMIRSIDPMRTISSVKLRIPTCNISSSPNSTLINTSKVTICILIRKKSRTKVVHKNASHGYNKVKLYFIINLRLHNVYIHLFFLSKSVTIRNLFQKIKSYL